MQKVVALHIAPSGDYRYCCQGKRNYFWSLWQNASVRRAAITWS